MADRANYTREQALFLHFFVSELMILPEDLEEEIQKIQEHNSDHSKTIQMKHSEHTRRMLDRIIQNEFGVSMLQTIEEIAAIKKENRAVQKEAKAAQKEVRKAELAEKKARQEALAAEKQTRAAQKEAEAAQKAKEQLEEALKNTIIHSYQKLLLSIPEIVELTGQTSHMVETVLANAKLIEK